MDEKGFIISMDAALMLIPIFIIVATVSGMNLSVPHESPYYQSQDVMETLYNIGTNSSSINLATIANNITAGNTDTANTMANDPKFKNILDKSGRNYKLVYLDSGGFHELVSNDPMSNPNDIASVTRTYNNVIFKLYMW